MKARLGKSDTTLPRHNGVSCDGWGARNQRREMENAGNAGRLGGRYKSHHSKVSCNQSASQIGHRRLNAGVAIRTRGRLRLGLVVME